MEAITRHNLIAQLLKTVPEFSADPEDSRDNLTYLVFNDFARFVNSLLPTKDHEELLQRIFGFIECASTTHNPEIIEVLRDSFNELAIQHPERATSIMGPHTRRIFEQTQEDVYGSSSAIRKIGRLIKRL